MNPFKNLFNKGGKSAAQNKTNNNVKEETKVDLSFVKSLDLEERFEDMFPGERPDEVTVYDLHGNEVSMDG